MTNNIVDNVYLISVFIVIIFLIIGPFIDNQLISILYLATVPNMLVHWYLKSDNCSLGVLESCVSKEPYYTKKIISPIYDVPISFEGINYLMIYISIMWIYVILRLFVLKNYNNKAFNFI